VGVEGLSVKGDARIRYSPAYVQGVVDETIRTYLIDSGIPCVTAFIEEGPSGVNEYEGDTGLLLLGYVGDPNGAFYLNCRSGVVCYLVSGRSFFVNSSPRQFATSLQAYVDVTRGELAGQDELVEERLRSKLLEIDPAAIEDAESLWNDTLGDISMGVYGDES
jgi:hypothetical protein